MSMSSFHISGVKVADFRSVYFDPARTVDALGLVRISRDIWPEGFGFGRPTRPDCLLVAVVRGAGDFDGSAGPTRYAGGSVCSVVPGVRHGWRAEAETEVVTLTATGPAAETLWRNHLAAPSHLERADMLVREATALHSAAETARPFSTTECLHRTHLLLLAAHRSRVAEAATGPSERKYRAAREYIESQFLRISSTEQVAERVGVSPTHLARLFRRYAQRTPKDYLNLCKMRHAADRLRGTDSTLEQIARELGYADAFSLSKAFKRTMKRSPRSCRTPEL